MKKNKKVIFIFSTVAALYKTKQQLNISVHCIIECKMHVGTCSLKNKHFRNALLCFEKLYLF